MKKQTKLNFSKDKEEKDSTKKRKPKRVQTRAFELILENYDLSIPVEQTFKELLKLKFGVYKGFATAHTKEGKTHVHIGVILRDAPRSYNWSEMREYFSETMPNIKQVGQLKSSSRNFDRKLQVYYDYTRDEKKHPGEKLHKTFLYRFEPMSTDTKAQAKPKTYLANLIFCGMTVDELHEYIDEGNNWTMKTRMYALENCDKLEKMIEKLDDIRTRKRRAKLYEEKRKTYRQFQEQLAQNMDEQDDRTIHNHYDDGKTGKNYFIDTEGLREDTLILQTAETKRIAHAWNPKKHKRIIFDIPKGVMEHLNTSVIEKLKNGTIFSAMYDPKTKISDFKPAILILGNERVKSDKWTDDRATYSTTSFPHYQYRQKY